MHLAVPLSASNKHISFLLSHLVMPLQVFSLMFVSDLFLGFFKMIHTPQLWLRKVDDTFIITKYDKIKTLDELNKFNCKVQFTYESATDNTLSFLDCLIEIDNKGRLQTKVYRKKTHTGQYMHYTSNQPENIKLCTIKTLLRRAKIVCCTEESLTDELNYIKKTMRLNGYPEKLITKTT